MGRDLNNMLSLIHRMNNRMTLSESEKYTESLVGDDYEIKTFLKTDSEWVNYILPNVDKILDFLNKGYHYANLGDFQGCSDAKSFKKNGSLVKIAFCGDEWIAVSVYSSTRGGFKCVGMTASILPEYHKIGVIALQEIIKEDVSNFEKLFWCECSDKIEEYYRKYNGIGIQSIYVPMFLGPNADIISYDKDGFHYTRYGKNKKGERVGEPYYKMIFGFNTQETFDKIYSEQKEYIDKCIDNIRKFNIGEGVLKDTFESLGKWTVEMEIIEFFNKHYNKGYRELPEESISELDKTVSILKSMFSNKEIPPTGFERQFMDALREGTYLLDVIQPLKLNKFC